MEHTEIKWAIYPENRQGSSDESTKTRPDADSLMQNYNLNWGKKEKIRSTQFDLNNFLYDYVVKVKNRYYGPDLMNRMPEELGTEIEDIIKDEANKNILKCKRQKKVKLPQTVFVTFLLKQTNARLCQHAMQIGKKKNCSSSSHYLQSLRCCMLAIPYNKGVIHSLGERLFFNANKNAKTSYWL